MARRSRVCAILCAILLALLTGQSAMAAGGQVTAQFQADSLVSCGGSISASLTLAGQSPPPGLQPVDVMLSLDRSGSLGSSGMNAVKTAATTFINHMDSSDGTVNGAIAISRVGLVSFSTTATLNAPLTHNANAVKAAVNSMSPGGSTNISHGIDLAQAQLATSMSKRVMIFMSDGQPNATNRGGNPVNDAIAAAGAAKAAGTEIYAIGLGTAIQQSLLHQIASGADHVYIAPTSADLQQIFQTIAQGVAGPAATGMQYRVDAGPDFTVTSATATKGSVAMTPDGFVWTLTELRTEGVTISYTMNHTGATNGAKAAHAMAQLTWTDDDGNPQGRSYSDHLVTVDGCNNPPVANAGPDQVVPMTGASGATLTLDGSASSDDGNNQPLTYTWSEGAATLGTGATLSHTFPLGVHHVSLTVFDGEFSDTDEVVITVEDRMAPVTTIAVSGTMGLGGWYVSPVSVSVTAEDNPGGSGVGYTSVMLDGGAMGTAFTVSDDGVHMVQAYSVDNAGNVEATQAAGFQIDSTGPTVTVTSPMAAEYTVEQRIGIAWSAVDSVSGIASTSADIDGAPVSHGDTIDALSLALGDHTLTVAATDVAGNSTTVTVSFRIAVTYDSLEALKHRFYEEGLITNRGTVVSLDQKLRAARSAHERGSHGAEVNILEAFINEVESQRSKHIDEMAANYLIMYARELALDD